LSKLSEYSGLCFPDTVYIHFTHKSSTNNYVQILSTKITQFSYQ